MNSYLVKTTNTGREPSVNLIIVQAKSVNEAMIKQVERMKFENEEGHAVSFSVTKLEVIE